MTVWIQTELVLAPRPRGIHLVTREVEAGLPDLHRCRTGLCHVFIQHTSASLSLNENVSPDVRADLDEFMNRLVPDGTPYFRHTIEGPDDMPAHVKASLLGSSLVLPIRDGGFRLGTWQGIYLCEHRDHGGSRRLTVTLFGETE